MEEEGRIRVEEDGGVGRVREGRVWDGRHELHTSGQLRRRASERVDPSRKQPTTKGAYLEDPATPSETGCEGLSPLGLPLLGSQDPRQTREAERLIQPMVRDLKLAVLGVELKLKHVPGRVWEREGVSVSRC